LKSSSLDFNHPLFAHHYTPLIEEALPHITMLFRIIVFSSLSFVSFHSEASETLCASSEVVRFSCVIEKSRKIASVCASPNLNKVNGYIQYRFGSVGHIELEFPSSQSGSQSKFRWIGDYGHGEDELLSFESGPYEYQIKRRVPVYESELRVEGVRVFKTVKGYQKIIAEINCDFSTSEHSMDLGGIIDAPNTLP
jgi:hypothetical protein